MMRPPRRAGDCPRQSPALSPHFHGVHVPLVLVGQGVASRTFLGSPRIEPRTKISSPRQGRRRLRAPEAKPKVRAEDEGNGAGRRNDPHLPRKRSAWRGPPLPFGARNFFAGPQDRRAYGVEIIHDLVVPEPDHPQPLASQKRRPPGVTLRITRMLPSIDFDNQPKLRTHEIHIVRPHRLLPLPPKPAQPTVAQASPNPTPRLGLLAPQPPRSLDRR
jgi:hypothetical protein